MSNDHCTLTLSHPSVIFRKACETDDISREACELSVKYQNFSNWVWERVRTEDSYHHRGHRPILRGKTHEFFLFCLNGTQQDQIPFGNAILSAIEIIFSFFLTLWFTLLFTCQHDFCLYSMQFFPCLDYWLGVKSCWLGAKSWWLVNSRAKW